MPKLATANLSNILHYTTSDNQMLDIKSDAFDAKIVLHTYNNGKGQIIFNKQITSIEKHAFSNCSSLTSITIPNSVTLIGIVAFSGCTGLMSVTIPNSVTSIRGGAFSCCSSLTSITIPDSVTSIGPGAFSGCSSLTSVTIPNSVTWIGENAFAWCKGLTAFYGKYTSSDNRCLIINDVLNSFAPARLTEYTISDNITSIGECAFCDCSSLTSVIIPNSVTFIRDSAFRGCSSLTSITIPDSVTMIGHEAFEGCTSLESITIPNSVTEIGNLAFDGCMGELIINSRAFVGKDYAYRSSPIDHNGWLNGNKFTQLAIGNSITKIGDYTFFGCGNLTSVTIGSGVTEIGENAFAWCDGLTIITIPDSVTSIAEGAFYECSSLKTIICKASTPPKLEDGAFANIHKNATIIIQEGCDDAYANSDWKYLFEE